MFYFNNYLVLKCKPLQHLLQTFGRSETLIEAINSIETCPFTAISKKSIKNLQEDAFSLEKGGRPNVRSIAVLVSDSTINQLADLRKESVKVKLFRNVLSS